MSGETPTAGRGKREPRKSNPSRLYAIARNVVEDSRFPGLRSTSQAALLAVFLRAGDSAGVFWVSRGRVAEWIGTSESTAKRALHELVAAGFLIRTPWYRTGPGGPLEGASQYRLAPVFLEWRGDSVVRGVTSDPPYENSRKGGHQRPGVTSDPAVRGVTSDPAVRGVTSDPADRSLPVFTRGPDDAPRRGREAASPRVAGPEPRGDEDERRGRVSMPDGCSECRRFAGEDVLVSTAIRGRPLYLCDECLVALMETDDDDDLEDGFEF